MLGTGPSDRGAIPGGDKESSPERSRTNRDHLKVFADGPVAWK